MGFGTTQIRAMTVGRASARQQLPDGKCRTEVRPTNTGFSIIRGVTSGCMKVNKQRYRTTPGRQTPHHLGCPEGFRRCQPWRAKRRLVVPSSREAALFSRRALRQRENKVGLRTRRPVIGRQVRSSNELAKLLRSAW